MTSGDAFTVTPAAPTTYTLTVSNALGTSTTASVTITVVAAPTITSFTAAPSAIKVGSSVTLTAVFANGTGSVDNGVGAVVSGVGKVATPVVSTLYTLTVTNAAGTSATVSTAVSVATVQSVAVTPSTPTIANGTAIQLNAVATFSDNTTQTVTTTATWNPPTPRRRR